jgi:hypothetical protein
MDLHECERKEIRGTYIIVREWMSVKGIGSSKQNTKSILNII